MADFHKCKRDAKLLLSPKYQDWRLASVDEVLKKENLAKIKENGILNPCDTARLLNGCVRGKYSAVKQYRPNLEDMLLIKTEESRPSDGSFPENMYSGYSEDSEDKGVQWTTKGGIAALLLSAEDKITEAICFILYGIVQKKAGDGQRAEELNKLTKSLQEKFGNGRTVLHYAVDQPYNKKHGEYVAKKLKDDFKGDKSFIKAADRFGRTALHFAAFHGNTEVCRIIIEDCEIEADGTDINKENVLHFAVKGKQKGVLHYLLPKLQSIIGSPDAQGRTTLHKAAVQGDGDMIDALLLSISVSKDKEEQLTFIRQSDLFGQTALLEAARGGRVGAVELLLNRGSRPLHERNSDGRSALHYAVQLSNQNDAVKMAESLLEGCESDEERSLLLWASATGSGTAEQASPESSEVQKYLKEKREGIRIPEQDLLCTAIKLGPDKIAWGLVKRGANTAGLSKRSWNPEERQRVENLKDQLHKIKKMPEQGRDQPAIDDSLGRKEFAEGLAELFLNPYVKSPITVGISGDWGMGKSSLMIQTEAILLKKAAQLAFPGLLATEQFPGCRQIEQSTEGQRKFEQLNKAMKKSSDFKIGAQEKDDPLLHFLNDKYREEHRDVYKSLAVMDRTDMMKAKGAAAESSSNEYLLRNIPTILTVRYNAWHYQNQSEAWAGLAVETTKAIEESMTTAQRVRCIWRYAWRKQRNTIWMELFLPGLLALFLSGWLAWVLWKIFSKSKNNELVQLTYGSIPITILLVIWTVMKQFLSVIKPVSAQIMGYFSKTDHTTNLGYQHQVISDIKLLKEEIGKKPSRKWKFIWWLCNLVNLYPDYSDNIKGTSISKSPAPGEENIRMIVFVDDLDRCEDTIILKVLSAVNLVLAACDINVVLGMDEKMIAKAMKHQFADNKEDQEELNELTKKYLSKIVQLPLALPDTSEDETKNFLRKQRGSRSQNLDDKVAQQASSEETDRDEQSQTGQSPAHVCLAVCENVTEKRKKFFSKLSRVCKPFTMFKIWLKPDSEDSKEILKKRKSVTVPLNFQRLMTNYSEEESQALDDLSEAATGERRLPREWKRFLTYHRVAWNILSQSETVKRTPGWQMQLVVWLFCCWQWEHQINDIIKDWKKIVPVNGFFKDGNDCLESTKPSLNYLIQYHRPSPEEEEKTEDDTQKTNKQKLEKQELDNKKSNSQDTRDQLEKQDLDNQKSNAQEKQDQLEKQDLDNQKSNAQETSQLEKQDLDNQKEKEKEREKGKNWYSLKEMLDKERKGKHRYDVSLECILSFQKFRLHCDIGHLSSPKTNGNKERLSVHLRKCHIIKRKVSKIYDLFPT